MTDRKLLELAARAGDIKRSTDWMGHPEYNPEWNPMKNDGDALRLAATLCFSVIQYKHSVEIMIGDDLIHRELSDGTMKRIELTRRAITRAAAEMSNGKDN